MDEHDKVLPECKMQFDDHEKDINGIKKSMFGDDGLSGVCGCLKSKVSKKTLVVIALAVSGFIIAGLTAWGGAKDERKENKQAIAVIQSELGHIVTTVESIEKNQIKPEKLLNEIRKIIQKPKTGEIESSIPYREEDF